MLGDWRTAPWALGCGRRMGSNFMNTCRAPGGRYKSIRTASFALENFEPRLLLTAFTVTSSADAGVGTLRQAITDANASIGLDSISFNIVGVGVPTINLASALPAITDPLSINGATQPSANSIDLNGGGATFYGLVILAGGSTVRGLLVRSFGGHGLVLSGQGGNTIVGNSFGVDSSGTKRPNALENILIDNSPNNVIGGVSVADRNLIDASNS